jgi:hypothetical protein
MMRKRGITNFLRIVVSFVDRTAAEVSRQATRQRRG